MSDSFSAWIGRVHGNSTCSLPPPITDGGPPRPVRCGVVLASSHTMVV